MSINQSKHKKGEYMSKIYGYKEKDVGLLYEFIKKNGGLSLSEIFARFSAKYGKSKGTVRNLYYAMAKKSREDEKFKDEFLKGETFTVKQNEKFDKAEEKKLFAKINALKEKGYSVRRAVNVLSGGDCKLALRYQNKYRNVIKAENKNAPHGAAALLKKIRPDEDMAEFSGERLITLKNEINALYDRLFGRIKRENEYLKSRVAALTEELANASAFGSDGTLGYFKNGEKNERVN